VYRAEFEAVDNVIMTEEIAVMGGDVSKRKGRAIVR